MIDDIVMFSCIEALIVWLLEMCDYLSFVSVTCLIFFFSMLLTWKCVKESKND